MIHLSFLTGTEIHVDETFPYSLDEDEVCQMLYQQNIKKKAFN